ncbi:GNAT family acetyltransferase Nat4 [Blastomyces gilchristii SLH14081]|uniref:N-alpha-acetyltransferase 40 n=1 Tax=Blastomyces gilchristii (strain SLH14081) TaxID=559298 RepID=A0A179UDT6_BLAGS|nr:GNAT family acetyltransferase Nat4 [Blastomyces gilchristii SLH14081]OAT06134.1 GNAT family acetyltransferase Nat4 [Blastomyces gilchristii SLH14081]
MLGSIREEAMSFLRRVRDGRIAKPTTAFSTNEKHALATEALERNGMEKILKENKNGVSDRCSKEVVLPRRKQASYEPKPPAKRLQLVESVNALPLKEFMNHCIPPRIRDFSISIPCKTPTITDQERYDTYSIEIHSSSSIPKADLESCFLLVKLTSSEMYKHSTTGWSPSKKKNEMKLLDMRYMLLVRTTTPGSPQPPPTTATSERQKVLDKEVQTSQMGGRKLGGFLSFMVTYEDEIEVLYCYEIHLAPELQHRGLGKILLGYYEEIGRNIGLQKTMLTVFKANGPAIRFYERLGYAEDEFSPKPMRLRNGHIREYDYMILSKVIDNTQTTKHDTNNIDVVW